MHQKKKKNKAPIIISIILLLIASGFCVWYFLLKDANSGNGAKIYVESVARLTGQNLSGINRFSGIVEPQQTSDVNADSTREILEVYVEVGDEVEKDQKLFAYDTTNEQLSIDKAKLDLENITADISNKYRQIKELEEMRKNASKDQQLEYTIQIQTLQTDVKQREFSKKSKQTEIDNMVKKMGNSVVKSPMSGVIKYIAQYSEGGGYEYDSDGSNAFIKILDTGKYRIRGTVSEQHIMTLSEGTSVIIRSRVDEEETQTGVINKVDTESPISGGNEGNIQYSQPNVENGGISNSASKYYFFVTLESAENLILGQHVYVEPDFNQAEVKEGLWLGSYYILEDEDSNYVWKANKKGRLEKVPVELGEYDEALDQYEILSGLTTDDFIAFPMEGLEEGMSTVTSREEEDLEPIYENMDPENGDVPVDEVNPEDEYDEIPYNEEIPENIDEPISDANTDEVEAYPPQCASSGDIVVVPPPASNTDFSN